MNKALEARTVEELIQFSANEKRPKYVYFWGHTPKTAESLDNSCFSQWFPADFEVEGVRYPTAEHFMMAAKAKLFGDIGSFNRVLEANSPGAAKAIGRQVNGFHESTWLEHQFEIVVTASLAKFSSSPELSSYLLNTSKRVLVEASPLDKVWGIGMDAETAERSEPSEWKGLNLLGFALMEARNRLSETG